MGAVSGVKSDISTAYYALLEGKLRAAKKRQNKDDLIDRRLSAPPLRALRGESRILRRPRLGSWTRPSV